MATIQIPSNIKAEFRRAQREKSTELSFTEMKINDLVCQKLMKLITEHFSHITRLDLSENEISVLPAAIGGLKHLAVLNLAGNNLQTIPDEVGQLTDLNMLDLSNNEHMTVLPEAVRSLHNLNQLDLEYTGITEISAKDSAQLRKFDYCNLPDGVELPKISSTASAVVASEDQVVPN